ARAISRGSPRGGEARMRPPADMTCHELVELVTAYLEGALPPAERERFEAHRHGCPGCRAHISQVRLTVSSLRQLQPSPGEDLSAEQRRILDLFRTRGLHRQEPRFGTSLSGSGASLQHRAITSPTSGSPSASSTQPPASWPRACRSVRYACSSATTPRTS